MAKAKTEATKVETAPVVSKPADEVKPFTKQAQLNPRKKKKASPESIAPVEQPQVETPAPIETPTSIEQKVEPPKSTMPDGVAAWLTSPDIPSPHDFVQALANLYKEIDALKNEIAAVKEEMAHKRKPVANGRVQVKDTETGAIYKSKNAVYQSMLKAGSLDDLVKQGIFGADPAHNTFGVYALFRAFPGRFIEIKAPEAPECK